MGAVSSSPRAHALSGESVSVAFVMRNAPPARTHADAPRAERHGPYYFPDACRIAELHGSYDASIDRRTSASQSTHSSTFVARGEYAMTDRQDIERLLRGLYAARVSGDLAAVCDKFTSDARFQIAGASHATPVAVTAIGAQQYKPLLAIMIKTFKLMDEEIISLLIDGANAAVHWRAKIFSRITGTTVLTELVDMIETRDGHISSYVEFFAPH
jgi:ketosteroid isomerase-like protein